MAADTAVLVAPGGATVVAPPGWRCVSVPPVLRLIAPGDDFVIAVVDIGEAAGVEAAAEQAWRLYDPDAALAPVATLSETAKNGWSAAHVFDYPSDGAARQLRRAYLLRHAERWTALLLDGPTAIYERSGGAIFVAIQTLTAPGFTRETFADVAPRRLDAERILELRTFFDKAMRALDIPGAALALVDREHIVLSEGFGVRSLGGEPVTPETRFLIASLTKSLTTLMLAKLVDEEIIDWDQPAHAVLPAFRTGDPALTARIRIRDLLSASTGLPRKDFVWAFAFDETTPAEMALDLLADMVPTTQFGEAFQYNNLVAAAAGYVGAHAAYPGLSLGQAYDRAMATRVFAPLGMIRTTFDFAVAEDGGEARAHGVDAGGATVAVDPRINRAVAASRPAGGAWSTIADLATYVRDEVMLGLLPDGSRHVSEANLLVRRQPAIPIGADGAYGIGLFIDRASGVETIRHGGSLPGYASDFVVVPGARVGCVVLANADAGGVLAAVFKRRLLEVLYGGAPLAEQELAAAVVRRYDETAALRASLHVPPPAETSRVLAPHYHSPELGPLTVDREAGELRLCFASGGMRMGARDDGVLLSVEPGLRGIAFELDRTASPPALVIREGQHDYRYDPD